MGKILTVPVELTKKSTAGVTYLMAVEAGEYKILRLAYHVTIPGKYTAKWWTMRDKLTKYEAQEILDFGLDELDRLYPIPLS